MADMHVAETQALRETVAKACRILGKLDVTKGTTGHISARVPGTDTVLIRARGPGETGVRYTSADEVIMVDLDGRKLDGAADLDAPQEVFIHTWIYRTRPDVNSVLHAHPATAVLFTICNKPLLPLYGAFDPTSLRLLVEGIPTYPRSVLVSNDALGQELAAVMGKRACLMRGHGITTCGPSVEEATMTAIRLNDLAEMNYRAQLLGDPEPIPDDEIAQLMSSSTKKQARDAEDPRPPAMWRYYCKLAGEPV
jgi:ribulose-5-phosphate 4-epimerase/fuculose-1-phosphate aldolase